MAVVWDYVRQLDLLKEQNFLWRNVGHRTCVALNSCKLFNDLLFFAWKWGRILHVVQVLSSCIPWYSLCILHDLYAFCCPYCEHAFHSAALREASVWPCHGVLCYVLVYCWVQMCNLWRTIRSVLNLNFWNVMIRCLSRPCLEHFFPKPCGHTKGFLR